MNYGTILSLKENDFLVIVYSNISRLFFFVVLQLLVPLDCCFNIFEFLMHAQQKTYLGRSKGLWSQGKEM